MVLERAAASTSSKVDVTCLEHPPILSPSRQGHQFSGVRGFVAKSPVDLHKVCVLQLSTDGLQLVVRLVNNLGLYFRQGFGGVIPLSDSLPEPNQSGLCFSSSTSSTFFFISLPSIPLFQQKPLVLISIYNHLVGLRTRTCGIQESHSIPPKKPFQSEKPKAQVGISVYATLDGNPRTAWTSAKLATVMADAGFVYCTLKYCIACHEH